MKPFVFMAKGAMNEAGRECGNTQTCPDCDTNSHKGSQPLNLHMTGAAFAQVAGVL